MSSAALVSIQIAFDFEFLCAYAVCFIPVHFDFSCPPMSQANGGNAFYSGFHLSVKPLPTGRGTDFPRRHDRAPSQYRDQEGAVSSSNGKPL
jgi:hypothetical protein